MYTLLHPQTCLTSFLSYYLCSCKRRQEIQYERKEISHSFQIFKIVKEEEEAWKMREENKEIVIELLSIFLYRENKLGAERVIGNVRINRNERIAARH
jgi:hypothetical protein